jgi:hypothetical protein
MTNVCQQNTMDKRT